MYYINLINVTYFDIGSIFQNPKSSKKLVCKKKIVVIILYSHNKLLITVPSAVNETNQFPIGWVNSLGKTAKQPNPAKKVPADY